MGDFFLGEIRLFPFPENNVPAHWALCNGQLMSVQQNAALNALLGTQFGGDGRNTFALPDLRGRAIIGAYCGGNLPSGVWQKYAQGVMIGAESVTLTLATIPSHAHYLSASSASGETPNPANGVYANANGSTATFLPKNSVAHLVALDPDSVSVAGSSLAHNNMQPFTTLNYCIATAGIFPQRP